MEYRHPPPAVVYGLYDEQFTNTSRPSQHKSNRPMHPNFSIPPPPFVPSCHMPPPQPPNSLFNPYPKSSSWGPNAVVSYNVPFPPQPASEPNSHRHEEQGYTMGPRDIWQSSYPDQNILQKDERAEDEEWVRNYTRSKLDKQKKIPILTSCEQHLNKMKICEATRFVDDCRVLLQDLESIEKDLMDRIDSLSSKKWQETCQIVENKKLRLLENVRKLSAPPTIQSLKVALLKRCKKREALKRRHALQKENKAASLKRQQQLHLSIDTWLEEMQRSVEKVKLEESLKQQADIVLSDVTRKKAEARRQLTLLSMLLKLRRIRVQAAANRGEHTSLELANIFENVVEKLHTFWSAQLKGYNLEEKGLRVMLEEATEDTSKNKKSLHQRILSEWQRLLFGRYPCINDFYTVAERDIDEFIAIRRDWDKFVVTPGALMASSIPVGWVLPVRPSSEQWERLLQGNQTKQ